MTDQAIEISNLGKRYQLGDTFRTYGRLSESLWNALRSPISSVRGTSSDIKRSNRDYVWALKDVSLEIATGDVVGLIGRNGAGKTTLLKILSRITSPTEGSARLRGRLGSLLEVGTGFHPELSGRDNVYLNGAILGMSKSEISRKFDQIAAFAEVERFMDTPVKRYSSGMYVRLAFSVAAHLEPDILVIDEVLAVGDVNFQKKSFAKLREISQQGRTVIFVSHNLAAVQNLCTRGVVLEQGGILFVGSQDDAVGHYLKSLGDRPAALVDRDDRIGSGSLRLSAIEMRDEAGDALDTAASGQTVDIYLYYEGGGSAVPNGIIASIMVKSEFDVPIFLHHNRLTGTEFSQIPERGAFVCRIRRLPLPEGSYRLTVTLQGGGEYLDHLDDATRIDVTAGDFFGTGEVPPRSHGLCLVDGSWRMEEHVSRESQSNSAFASSTSSEISENRFP